MAELQRFFVDALSGALELGLATHDDVLKHVTPDVLAAHLPRPLWAKLLGACLAAPRVDARLVVETIGVVDLCANMPGGLLWNVVQDVAMRALGRGLVAAPPPAMIETKLEKGADKAAAEQKSPLAFKLMNITGVTAVMLGSNFVTVTKGESGEWDELNDQVMQTLETHLTANEPVVNEGALERKAPVEGGSEVEQKIRDILEAEIRPAVMMDGGDITLDRFEDGIAYLHMKGSCAGCPSSTATLRHGIQNLLRHYVPDVVEVRPV